MALCQALRGASLLQPGWGAGSRGEGMLVAAPRLRHQALNGDPLSSFPCGSQLSLSLFAGGSRGFWKGNEPWKYPDEVSLSSTSIPCLNSNSHPRLPASPDQPLAPTLHPHSNLTTTTSTLSPWAAEWPLHGGRTGGEAARGQTGLPGGFCTYYQVALGKSLGVSCLVYKVGPIIPLLQDL